MTDAAYRDDRVTLYHGDCLDVLAELPDASVDSVVTDPPYGLDFMGKNWDTGAVAFDTAIWGHALRVLKPGGHLLAFGGTRTWHRLACAIEDAGFEIRDNIAWLYGSGFPKSLDVSKAIDKGEGIWRGRAGEKLTHNASMENPNRARTDKGAPATDDAKRWAGWGTALKPAFEPIVVGRKPLSGTVAATVLAHGTGALNIDGCRVGTDERETTRSSGIVISENRSMSGPNYGRVPGPVVTGRWPSNVVIDDATAAEVDRQSGITKGQVGMKKTNGGHRFIEGDTESIQKFDYGTTDLGGASRFFPTFRYQAKAPTDERPTADGIAHPTVKPLDLMRWLVRLVTPPGGTVLEPFAGSGTTAEACIHEHLNCIAIEREADYLPLIIARLTKPIAVGFNFDEGGTDA